MSGLVLKLAPEERFIFNGTVVENGSGRAVLNILTRNASILRLKDALHPDLAVTPVTRLILEVQKSISGDLPPELGREIIDQGLEALSAVFRSGSAALLVHYAKNSSCQNNMHTVLKLLNDLLPIESELLKRNAG